MTRKLLINLKSRSDGADKEDKESLEREVPEALGTRALGSGSSMKALPCSVSLIDGCF